MNKERIIKTLFVVVAFLLLEGCGGENPQVEGRLYRLYTDHETGCTYVRLTSRRKRVAKIDLGEGDRPPRVVGTVEQSSEEFQIASAKTRARGAAYAEPKKGAFDRSSDFTYRIELRPWPVRITKRRGYRPSGALIGAVPVPDGRSLSSGGCILTDASSGYLYIGTARGPDTPAQVFKIDPGEGEEPLRLVGSVLLASGEANLRCGVIDSARG